jgi:hypothetical protein
MFSVFSADIAAAEKSGIFVTNIINIYTFGETLATCNAKGELCVVAA